MSTAILPRSNTSFFSWAAWYSLTAPFATIAIGYPLLLLADRSNQPKYFTNLVSVGGLLVLASSLLLGIASLFGIPRHGVRVIMWKATVGILASCVIGLLDYGLGIANAFRNGP